MIPPAFSGHLSIRDSTNFYRTMHSMVETVHCVSGRQSVRRRRIIITDGGGCAVWICHTIGKCDLQYRCGFAVQRRNTTSRDAGVQYGGGTPSVWWRHIIITDGGVQYGGGLQYRSVTRRRHIFCTDVGLQYRGGTPQVGILCTVGKRHTISTDADVQCRSGTPLVRWRHIIITDGDVQYDLSHHQYRGGTSSVQMWVAVQRRHTISRDAGGQ